MNANYIEFYFDCSSPWTYLAFVGILPLARKYDLKIYWKPVLVGGVFNNVNQDVYNFRKKPNPLKLNYTNNDLRLWSQVRNISISFPEVFPVNSVKAMRGCIFALQENKLEQFAELVFHAYWTRGKDISKEDILLTIAQNANLNHEKFKDFIYSSQAKHILIENTQELIDKGGFGSPTFFYNNQMFFGNDRLALFEESLKTGFLD